MKRRLLNLLTLLPPLLCAAVAASGARADAVAAPPSDASNMTLETIGALDGAGGQSVCFSRDGSRILTAGEAGAQLWDARALKPIGARMDVGDGVRFARFDSAAKKVLVFRSDREWVRPGWETTSGEVRLFDATTGNLLRAPIRHGDRPAADADISPDGTLVATCNEKDDTVLVWEVESGKRVASLRHERPAGVKVPLVGVRFDPSGRTVLTTLYETNTLWDVATWRRRAEMKGKPGYHGDPPGAAFSADGTRLALVTDTIFEVYDVATGRKVCDNQPHFLHLDMFMSNVSISADGRRVGTASTDGGVVWDGTTGLPLRRGKEGPYTIAPTLNGDGSIALFEEVYTEAVIDVATGKRTVLPQRDQLKPFVASFSPTGSELAVGTYNDQTVIYRLKKPPP